MATRWPCHSPLCVGDPGACQSSVLKHWFSPQCSSLYEEKYVLPSQTLNSQGSSPPQETHPLLGEWNVSTRPQGPTPTL